MPELIYTQANPDGTGEIVDPACGALWARVLGGNPLDPDWPARAVFDSIVRSSEPPQRVVIWSGTGADELFASDPRSWLSETRGRFDRFIDETSALLDASGIRLLLRPHARHVLSDAPSLLTFLSVQGSSNVGVLLDVASMFEPAMIADAHVHLGRLAGDVLPRADAVLLANVCEGHALGADLVACKKNDGLIGPSLLENIASQATRDAIWFGASA